MDRKKQTLIAAPLLALVLIGAGVFYVKVIKVRSDYNRIVTELLDAGKNEEAAKAFEKLRPRAVGGMQAIITKDLAETYRVLGDDPALNFEASRRHFERAQELDPEGMQPHQRRVLQSAPGKNGERDSRF